MKGKFTYKILTLLLGIVVAVIIMITLWLKPVSEESGEVSEKSVQKIIVPVAKILTERTYILVTKIYGRN